MDHVLESQHIDAAAPASDRVTLGPVFQAVKEWAGLASIVLVMVAQLWHNAFDFRAFLASDVVSARAAIGQIQELTAAKILALQQVSKDVDQSDAIAKSFDSRIFNIVSYNQVYFVQAKADLSMQELTAIGSNYAISGRNEESLPFFQEAVAKRGQGEALPYAIASREYGIALFHTSNARNKLQAAEQEYVEALTTIGIKKNGIGLEMFAQYLSELAIFELQYGDWKCGLDELGDTMNYYKILENIDDTAELRADKLSRKWKTATIVPGQKQNGCPYTLPKPDWLKITI